MKMKRWVVVLAMVLVVGASSLMLEGCASTNIQRLPADEFLKHAQVCDREGSFAWTTYIGVSHQRAYLEYGHPAFIGKGNMTTVYWTPLEELPSKIAVELKSGKPPWTNWMDRIYQPQK